MKCRVRVELVVFGIKGLYDKEIQQDTQISQENIKDNIEFNPKYELEIVNHTKDDTSVGKYRVQLSHIC